MIGIEGCPSQLARATWLPWQLLDIVEWVCLLGSSLRHTYVLQCVTFYYA